MIALNKKQINTGSAAAQFTFIFNIILKIPCLVVCKYFKSILHTTAELYA